MKNSIKTLDIPSFNIQRYLPGDHFSKIHTERASTSTSHRVFAWMTYLNAVNEQDGGCPNFSTFNLKIKPKKGLSLIWPTDFTHTHRGIPSPTEEKMIVTGGFDFI